jgi:hypothetical protein
MGYVHELLKFWKMADFSTTSHMAPDVYTMFSENNMNDQTSVLLFHYWPCEH